MKIIFLKERIQNNTENIMEDLQNDFRKGISAIIKTYIWK